MKKQKQYKKIYIYYTKNKQTFTKDIVIFEEQISDSPLVIPTIFLLLFWTNLSIDVDILRMIKLNWKIYL